MGLLSAALVMAASTQATAQEYTFTTLAGPPELGAGSADGPGSLARFRGPYGVAVDSAGNVYVADYRQQHDPEGDARRRGDDAGRAGGKLWQRRRHGQRRAVLRPIRRGGGQRGQRLRGGHRQPHDSEGDARRRGDDAGRAGGKLWAAPTARAAPRGSTTHTAWRWTARATSTWRTPATTRFGR